MTPMGRRRHAAVPACFALAACLAGVRGAGRSASPTLTIVTAYERQMAFVTAARSVAAGQRAVLWKALVADPIDKACAMGGEYAALGASTLARPAADLDGLEAEVVALRQADLSRVIGQAFDRASAALPGPDTTICVVAAYPGATAVTTDMHGVSAVTTGAGKIWLTVHPGGDWLDWLAFSVAHEHHHSAWTQRYFHGRGRRADLLDYLVFEGRAEWFAHTLYPAMRAPWAHALDDDALRTVWRRIEPRLGATDPDLKHTVMFGGPDVPHWAGYSIGYAIVERYCARHPKASIADWTALDPDRLFADSGFDPGK